MPDIAVAPGVRSVASQVVKPELASRRGPGAGDVEVAIDPAELEGLDEEGVRALYEERLAQQRAGGPVREVRGRALLRIRAAHNHSLGLSSQARTG